MSRPEPRRRGDRQPSVLVRKAATWIDKSPTTKAAIDELVDSSAGRGAASVAIDRDIDSVADGLHVARLRQMPLILQHYGMATTMLDITDDLSRCDVPSHCIGMRLDG